MTMTAQDEERSQRLRVLGELRLKHARQGATADVAYWTIRDAIRSGVIQPGDRLIELDLAAALEMSRTPVRDALRQLEAERLVEKAPSRGFMVPTITNDALIEIYEIREVLEGLAARRAAMRMGEAELAALRETVERTERARDAGDITLLSQASNAFHLLLRAGNTNGRLSRLLALMFDAHRSVRLHEFAPERVDAAVAEHRAIYEAIAARDSALAEQLAREHSRQALRSQLLAQHFTSDEA
ncbi:MAG: GntR family transcriptional regulator [Thermomicrobiales bacterium]